MDRRGFLALCATALAAPGVLVACGRRGSGRPARPFRPVTELPVPPVLEPEAGRVRLRLQAGRHAYLAGRPTESWGVNGPNLGPTVRVRRGSAVTMEVENTLPESTTLHWHGLEVPAAVDGGPHQPIGPGETWFPTLPIDQPAATLWYHPHPHGRTADHVHRGLAGLLYVDDPVARVDLPCRYGIDDLPLVLQDRSIAEDGSVEPDAEANFGYLGPDICVNGVLHPWTRVRTMRVRLRILNGSNARMYHLGFADGRRFHVVAGDLGLLPDAVTTDRVRIGPAERVELVVTFTPGERAVLTTTGGEERIDEGGFDLLEFRADPTLDPSPEVPAVLGGAPPVVPSGGATTRRFRLQGHDAINGRSMDMSRIDEVVPRSAVEIWEVENTVYSHNFHIHGVAFTILSVDGRPPQPWEAGRKDTVHLPPKVTTHLAVRFGHHVDPANPYMYHCHILRHEDAGMMGQYVVVEPGTEASTPRHVAGHAVTGGH